MQQGLTVWIANGKIFGETEWGNELVIPRRVGVGQPSNLVLTLRITDHPSVPGAHCMGRARLHLVVSEARHVTVVSVVVPDGRFGKKPEPCFDGVAHVHGCNVIMSEQANQQGREERVGGPLMFCSVIGPMA